MTRVAAGRPNGRARRALYRVGHGLNRPPDLMATGFRARRAARAGRFDVVWVDKGRTVGPRLLGALRRRLPGARFASYSPDDMMHPSWNSMAYLRSIPLYDLHVTTKSYNVPELRERGAREVIFMDQCFDAMTHRPLELDAADRARFGCDVGFVGLYEEARALDLCRLAKAGIPVSVRGLGWAPLRGALPGLNVDEGFLKGDEYTRAINATRINLGFLRKAARDLQTTRSVEIPACGAFMLAERTDEHLRLFEEGVEAEFFEGFDELLAKCRYYLEHEEERARIAAAGRRRCLESGYSYDDCLRRILDGLCDAPTPGDPIRGNA